MQTSDQLDELLAHVQALGISEDLSIATNKNFLRYFLKAKGNVTDALQMVVNYAKWRKENEIGVLNYDIVRSQLEMGKVCVLPNDNPACDMLAIFVSRLHYPRDFPTLTFLRSLIFLIELFMCEDQEHTGFIILNDMREVGRSNFDYKVSHVVKGLHACIPILPQKIIIYKPPLLFKCVWKIVSPFLNSSIINLMQIVKSPEELAKCINI